MGESSEGPERANPEASATGAAVTAERAPPAQVLLPLLPVLPPHAHVEAGAGALGAAFAKCRRVQFQNRPFQPVFTEKMRKKIF